ncbi:MAG: hypothetical protein HOP08_01050 [Cyclobacteriaceae bacterium]|nr:hypothetical protein [Cyclobacteriaceae bacterium]
MNEIKIKRRFCYTVTDDVINSLDGQTHAPLDSNPIENNKKQINQIPDKKKHNNIVLIDKDAKELLLTVPLRFKNSIYSSYLPDPVTLFLHLAQREFVSLAQLEEFLKQNYQAGTFALVTYDNNFHHKKFTYVISLIVFLIMTIEALVNEMLPDNALVDKQEMAKEKMERELTLEAKIKVLQDIGFKLKRENYNKVIYLKKLRNDIVHLKSFSKDINKVKSVYPFDEILNLDVKKYFNEILSIVETLSPGRTEYLKSET